MKNNFSPQLLIKLGFIFSSCVLSQSQSAYADTRSTPEKLNELSWEHDHESELQSSSRHAAVNPTGSEFHSPGQLLFSIESSPNGKVGSKNNSQSSANTPKPHSETTSPKVHASTASYTKPTASQHQSTTIEESKPITVQRSASKLPPPDFSKLFSQFEKQPLISQAAPELPPAAKVDEDQANKTILINFNNVSIIEYIRFISRISNKNFVFDDNDLQFNVTIISEEPTTIDNIMTALLQELRIHDLSLMEQGNNLIIHKNPRVNSVSQVVADDIGSIKTDSELVTQVFRLNTVDPDKIASVIRPLTSSGAIIDVLKETNHLVITDLSSNVAQIAKLIRSLDSPASGLVIGQYVVRTTSIDTLIPIAQKIMLPISQDQPLIMVPWTPSNSIFIVSSPYLVERTITILQHIDQNQKATKIFDLKDLKYDESLLKETSPEENLNPAGLFFDNNPYEPIEGVSTTTPEEPTEAPRKTPEESGQWKLDSKGNWVIQVKTQPGQAIDQTKPPPGSWQIDTKGNWLFKPATTTGFKPVGEDNQKLQPKGEWFVNPEGSWEFQLEPGESITVDRLSRPSQDRVVIPPGPKTKSMFYIHKMQYRKGDMIQKALQSIADSLREDENFNPALVHTMISVQWIEPSNSLIFTGTRESLSKIRELVDEIDVPLRQVFIEMLILETSVEDSLHYGVNWGTRFGGGNWAGAQGFNTATPLNAALNTTGTNSLGSALTPVVNPDGTVGVNVPTLLPDPRGLVQSTGLNMGVIGQSIVNTAMGIEFNSIGALLQALHQKSKIEIILNPKIITEDLVPAEIFVGENTSFKTQSIANDQGSTITSNFEFRDVGTRLRVTPLLGNNDIITLEISQEQSQVAPPATAAQALTDATIGPTTLKSTTTTRVHVPDGYFIIISGMIRDETRRDKTQVPCLGGVPLVGAAFKDKTFGDTKRNLMIFIRPQIIDTEEEIQNLTKHQQDIYKFKKQIKKDWVYETEEALDFLNLRRAPQVETDPEFEDYD